ncbi:sensor domain-containing diguanylate cyclase [Salinispira pacifica]
MIRNFFFGTINRRLNVITILPIVLLFVGVFLVFGLHLRGLILQDQTQEQVTALSVQRHFIERWLEERLRDVVFLSQLRQLRDGSVSDIDLFLREFVDRQAEFDGAIFIDRSGRVLAGIRSGLVVDQSSREFFREAVSGTSTISDVIVGRASGRRLIVFAAPVYAGSGTLRGVAAATVPIEALGTLLGEVNPRAGSRTYILSRSGDLIARSTGITAPANGASASESGASAAPSEILQRALAGSNETRPYTGRGGEAVLGSYQWLRNGMWLLVYETPLSSVLSTYSQYNLSVLAGMLAVIAVLIPLMLLIARTIERPLAALTTMAAEIQNDEYDLGRAMPGIERAPREIRNLHDTLVRMARRIRDDVRELERLATTDVLTGIANRRLFVQEAPRILDISTRSGTPVCFLMLDLDHFKRINDSHGHEAGDVVLAAVADELRRTVRESDFPARMGGEEFAVVAPNCRLDAAGELAERIRRAVADRVISTDAGELRCRVSVGVAQYDEDIHGHGIDGVLEAADAALYEAKRKGRNRVVLSKRSG